MIDSPSFHPFGLSVSKPVLRGLEEPVDRLRANGLKTQPLAIQ
jgi:hypothetical protein